jgi:hypothetical protein
MLTRYTVYRPGADPQHGEIDWPEDPGYDRIKALVVPLLDGADPEHLHVLAPDRVGAAELTEADDWDMFVDENGIWKNLDENRAATKIYHGASRHRGETIIGNYTICGPAVLIRRTVWF